METHGRKMPLPMWNSCKSLLPLEGVNSKVPTIEQQAGIQWHSDDIYILILIYYKRTNRVSNQILSQAGSGNSVLFPQSTASLVCFLAPLGDIVSPCHNEA